MSNSNRNKPPKLSKIRRADPCLERESTHYDQPLPSREYVLQVLAEHGSPASFAQLCCLLDVRGDEAEAFARRLGAMARDGQLMQNRRDDWLMPDRAGLLQGRVEGHPDGYGFLIPDEGGEDVFLSAKEMTRTLHGDHALVRVIGVDRKGRREGKVVEVTRRANRMIVGRLHQVRGVRYLTPENPRIAQDILVAAENRPTKKSKRARATETNITAKEGQVVVVELIVQPDRHQQPMGRIVEVLGDYADPGMEIEIALRKHDLPFVFSRQTLAACARLPDAVRPADKKGREDLTGLPLVTIDGETARDFDDAVYCEPVAEGFRLIVAIADVAHYVQEGSALDQDARQRGTSVYFPRRVIPMLPEKLSNGLCSLNPQVERLCMACEMTVTHSGQIEHYRFFPAVMFSRARLTYEEVAAALYDNDAAICARHAPLIPHLRQLDCVFRALQQARVRRGAIDFETQETRMIFDDQGKISRIEPEYRNDAHRLIEECMLAANVSAAAFLAQHKHPLLYRVHQGPTPQKLERLREFLATFGLALDGGDAPQATDYARLLAQTLQRPDHALLQTVMLRSLRQAVYSPENLGHFGLAYAHYTHFTSPIRRYPDLLIHRAIKAVLAKQQYLPGGEQAQTIWQQLGITCSACERRADEASRDVTAWLKCYYMQGRIGEEFSGSISSVTPFGVFVALDALYVEGLIHVSDLGPDYFHFDAAAHALIGTRSGQRYRIADRIRVRLVRVDLAQNRIDFVRVVG